MDCLLIEIPYLVDGNFDPWHRDTQHAHMKRFNELGITYVIYSGSSVTDHYWKIRCDEQQLSMLILSGATIMKNITAAKNTGFEKLTEDEKEALGLIKG